MSSIFYDGDFTVASAVSPRRKVYPFEGDTDSFYFEQDFVQNFADYERLTLDVADDEIENAYLVEETPLQELGIGVGRWTRIYSTIPNSRVEQETFAYTVPGIAPDPFVLVHPISASSTFGSYTRLTIGAPNFDLAVGDPVTISYSVVNPSPSMVFFRYVTRQVRAINSGAGTFDVDLITDIAAPVFNVAYKSEKARRPLVKVVQSYLHFDYFLPGVSAGIVTPADIPILQAAEIFLPTGDRTDSYSSITDPTLIEYRAAVLAGDQIVVEPSVIKRWKGNIYERVTRYVVTV